MQHCGAIHRSRDCAAAIAIEAASNPAPGVFTGG